MPHPHQPCSAAETEEGDPRPPTRKRTHRRACTRKHTHGRRRRRNGTRARTHTHRPCRMHPPYRYSAQSRSRWGEPNPAADGVSPIPQQMPPHLRNVARQAIPCGSTAERTAGDTPTAVWSPTRRGALLALQHVALCAARRNATNTPYCRTPRARASPPLVAGGRRPRAFGSLCVGRYLRSPGADVGKSRCRCGQVQVSVQMWASPGPARLAQSVSLQMWVGTERSPARARQRRSASYRPPRCPRAPAAKVMRR